MAHGNSFYATALIASLLFSGSAIAQSESGSGAGSAAAPTAGQGMGITTGPAAGSNVEPSTAIQKQLEHRSVSDPQAGGPPIGTPAAAGMVGAEGAPGTQSGTTENPSEK